MNPNMFPKILKIATRRSKLALWQTQHIANLIKQHLPDIKIELVEISTQGDKILDKPLSDIGGKGLFIKELEQAIENNLADIAVHSMKDVGNELPNGFFICDVGPRHDPSDAFISNKYSSFSELPLNATIGTSSLRRKMQIREHRPDLIISNLRGNIDTRLKKLDDNQYDAIILATAGIERLKLRTITQKMPFDDFLPAVGQGVIGIECKNEGIYQELKILQDKKTHICLEIERYIANVLNADCQTPLAVLAQITDQKLRLRIKIADTNLQNISHFDQQIDFKNMDNIDAAIDLAKIAVEKIKK